MFASCSTDPQTQRFPQFLLSNPEKYLIANWIFALTASDYTFETDLASKEPKIAKTNCPTAAILNFSSFVKAATISDNP